MTVTALPLFYSFMTAGHSKNSCGSLHILNGRKKRLTVHLPTGVQGAAQKKVIKDINWPRGSMGVQRYGSILRSAANNLGEIPKNLGAPNLLF